MMKALEKEVLCCLLVVLFGLGHFSFLQTAPKKQVDEIIKLEQELLQLKMLLKEVTTEKGFHIQVGRFDAPFANDWQYFAPVDCVSVTAPLTTEIVMDGGFNDVGLRILGAAVTYNYTLYIKRE